MPDSEDAIARAAWIFIAAMVLLMMILGGAVSGVVWLVKHLHFK